MDSNEIMNALWDATVQQVANLGLTSPVDNSIIPIVKRKLVRIERAGNLDSVVQITVFRPEQPEKAKYVAFGCLSYVYRYIVAIMYPGNQDLAANLDIYSQQRQEICDLFGSFSDPPFVGVPNTYDMRIEPDVFLPRSLIGINYDYQAMAVDYTNSITKKVP